MPADLRRLVSDPAADDLVSVAQPEALLTTIPMSGAHRDQHGLFVAVDDLGRLVGVSTADLIRTMVAV